jgi:hypothetical protein
MVNSGLWDIWQVDCPKGVSHKAKKIGVILFTRELPGFQAPAKRTRRERKHCAHRGLECHLSILRRIVIIPSCQPQIHHVHDVDELEWRFGTLRSQWLCLKPEAPRGLARRTRWTVIRASDFIVTFPISGSIHSVDYEAHHRMFNLEKLIWHSARISLNFRSEWTRSPHYLDRYPKRESLCKT